MERMEPREPDELLSRRRGTVRLVDCRAEQQTERRSARSEFSRRREGKVYLQGAGEQENAVDPTAGQNIEVVQRGVLRVHLCRPVGENAL